MMKTICVLSTILVAFFVSLEWGDKFEYLSLSEAKVIRGSLPCWQVLSGECQENVAATSCSNVACVRPLVFWQCPQNNNVELPPNTIPIVHAGDMYEVESSIVRACFSASTGFTNCWKEEEPVPCQEIYDCDCHPTQGGNCRRNNFVGNSTSLFEQSVLSQTPCGPT